MGTESEQRSLVERLRAQRERHRRRPRPVRALYIVVGFTVLILGLVMLVTPGPAFVVIPFGLALLSLEFAWAERLLDRALDKAEQAKAKARESTRTERVLTTIAVVLGCLAVAAWAYWGDIPILPV